MTEEQDERHPSYGVLVIAKAHYGGGMDNGRALFGSSIVHSSIVKLEIHRAVLTRELHRDFIRPDFGPAIVEVEMSTTQFAEAITSLNQASGTPVSIVAINGKSIEQPIFENKRLQFDAEFEAEMKKLVSESSEYFKAIAAILAKPGAIGIKDRQEILSQLRLLRQQLASNVPFVKKQFTEQMDATVLEAKNEVEAFLEGKVRSLGLEASQAKALTDEGKEAVRMLEEKKDAD